MRYSQQILSRKAGITSSAHRTIQETCFQCSSQRIQIGGDSPGILATHNVGCRSCGALRTGQDMASARYGYQVCFFHASRDKSLLKINLEWPQTLIFIAKPRSIVKILRKDTLVTSRYIIGNGHGFYVSVWTEAIARYWGSLIRSRKSE